LTDIGFEGKLPMYHYLSSEPDMATFASPGVNTFVTYGYNLSTPAAVSFPVDFNGAQPPTAAPIGYMGSGDGIIEVRYVRGLVHAFDLYGLFFANVAASRLRHLEHKICAAHSINLE
jgi:hypothetical protein